MSSTDGAESAEVAASAESAEREPASLGRKWAWFVGLWLGGVLAVGTVSALLRWVLLP